jgi:tRNA U34 2-thiouridine synthase MnmA/TrmU
MLKKAKAYMEASGAAFIVTGEVLGQRPMSQRRDAMRLIEKEAGLEGYILRPLSAKVLPVTVPEKEGWVDREKLLTLQGRSRKPQMALAEHYGIHDYPCPAGGCLLTDPGFAKRMKDLMAHDPNFSLNDVHLLKMGRHFRFSLGAKLVVGRQEEENQKIQTFAQGEDILLKVSNFPGPLSLLRGKLDDGDIEKAAAITAHYSKAKDLRNIEVTYKGPDEDHPQTLLASPISRGEVERWMICE